MFSIAGIAGLVALIPGAGATVGWLASALGFLVRCKPCLYALGTAALCGYVALHVHRADVEACDGRVETRLEEQRTAAAAAATARDGEIKADLEKSYAPALNALRALNTSLSRKVEDYAKQKPVAAKPAKAAGCKLGDAAGVLQRPDPAGKPASAAAGGIADYLRRHPGKD